MSEVNAGEVKVSDAAKQAMRDAEQIAKEAFGEVKPEKRERKPKEKREHGKLIYIESGNKKEMARIELASSEDDPHWDAKMLLPVPPSVVDGLAEKWDESMPLRVTPRGDKLVITQGRTKWRALTEANKRRAKNKLPPLVVPVIIIEEDDVESMRMAVRLNEHQRVADPITKARGMERLFAAGLTEADAAHDFGLSVKQVQEHYSLLSLPKKVQALIQSGKMSMTAALGLAHVDAKKVEALAEKLVDQAESVGRVTTRVAEDAAEGRETGPDRMNAKAVKSLIEELEATVVGGKHSKAALRGAVIALECVLDARKRGKIIAKLEEAAK